VTLQILLVMKFYLAVVVLVSSLASVEAQLPMWDTITKKLLESKVRTPELTAEENARFSSSDNIDALASSECSKHTTCGDCASSMEYFSNCRWCPLLADNKCHTIGSPQNPCSDDQQITDPSQCPALPSRRKPIVIMPGLIGSSLEVKLTDKNNKPSPICQTTADWYTIWLNPVELGPEIYKCSMDNWSLSYDKETERVANVEGVDLRYVGNEANDRLDNIVGWDTLVSLLLANGYEVGNDLFANPFDWRMGVKQFLNDEKGAMGPKETGGEFKRLKETIEEAFEKNDERIVLASVSYGGPYGNAFLTSYAGIDQAWKDKYLDSWISLSGVFNGAPQVVHQLIQGMPAYGIDYVDPLILRDSMRSFPSLSFLVPSHIDGYEDTIIAYTAEKNYTLSEVADLLEAGGAVNAADMKRKQTIITTSDPGVKVHCWYTSNMATEFSFIMESPNSSETLPIYGLGDQTGDVHSLSRCQDWKGVEVRNFDDVCHSCYLEDETVLNAFLELVVS